MKKRGGIQAAIGVALSLVLGAAQAALTTIAPACSASLGGPSWSDCAGAFEGNDKNQQADIQATILAKFGLAGALFRGASDEAGSGPFTANPSGYFDGAGAPVSAIDFTTLGVSTNPNGDGNGLSHASLFATQVVPSIPEPHAYVLMLAGLVAMGFLATRRRRD